MKNIVLFIIFLVCSFIINIFFYYNSEYYRDFIKGLKGDEVFLATQKNEENIENKEELLSIKDSMIESHEANTQEESLSNTIDDDIEEQTIEEVEIPEVKSQITLGKKYKDLINLFQDYELKELDINTKLFDITNEYPDQYFEYYSRDVTLYIFPTRGYTEVLDIFKVLEGELPFSVNVTNNFAEKTFYINLDKDIADNTIRMVISSNNRVFGLKIKNNEYNTIKSILNTLTK